MLLYMKRKALIIFLLLAIFSPYPALAAKKRIWSASAVSSAKTTSSLSVSAKLTGWKQYLNVGFKGVATTTGITYELVYDGNGTQQGLFGSVKPSEGNVTRSLFLGTCSHGACTAHKNVGNMHLTITYQTASGQTVVKKYKVKY